MIFIVPKPYFRGLCCRLMLLSMVFISGCGWGSAYPTKHWEYIVPDGYTGMLVIQYNCADGPPIHHLDLIVVAFNDEGLFCTQSASFASSGPQATARTRRGEPIPVVDGANLLNYHAYAVCCGQTRGIGGNSPSNPGENLSLGIRWVGEIVPPPDGRFSIPSEDYSDFLATHFQIDMNWRTEFMNRLRASPTPLPVTP